MAKKRTRRQKIKAKLKRQQQQAEYKFSPINPISSKAVKPEQVEQIEIEPGDKKLIIKDLIKTVVVAGVLLVLLILAYWRFR